MRNVFFMLMIAAATPARADVVAWIDSLEIDPGVIAELERFERDEGDWPDDTPERIVRQMKQRIHDDVSRAMARIARGEVDESVDVNFLSPGDFAHGRAETKDERGREFEEGFIRTEQVAFFPGARATPTEALETFVDPEFRRQTTSRIELLEEEGDLSCLRTGGVKALLSPTWACNRVTYLKTDSVAAEHSQVVSNPGGEDFQPIYFKESVKIFVPTDEGLLLYYINYTRGAKLGSFKKRLGRGKIEDSQRERAAALAERLDRDEPGN